MRLVPAPETPCLSARAGHVHYIQWLRQFGAVGLKGEKRASLLYLQDEVYIAKSLLRTSIPDLMKQAKRFKSSSCSLHVLSKLRRQQAEIETTLWLALQIAVCARSQHASMQTWTSIWISDSIFQRYGNPWEMWTQLQNFCIFSIKACQIRPRLSYGLFDSHTANFSRLVKLPLKITSCVPSVSQTSLVLCCTIHRKVWIWTVVVFW